MDNFGIVFELCMRIAYILLSLSILSIVSIVKIEILGKKIDFSMGTYGICMVYVYDIYCYAYR
jgi:uncharacterized membrane protein